MNPELSRSGPDDLELEALLQAPELFVLAHDSDHVPGVLESVPLVAITAVVADAVRIREGHL